MGTFDQLIEKLDADDRVKGHQFERIAKWFLINDPTYKSLLRRVWLWKEWRDRWSDLEAGIDIVAEDFDGRLWAVQCKAYRADRTITKADIDKFLSESNRPVFAERLLIATTDNIHHVARNTMSAQEKSVSLVGLEALRLTDSYLDWPDSPDDLRPPRPTKRARPHDYQLEAIKDVVKGLDDPRWYDRLDRWSKTPLDRLPREEIRASMRRFDPGLELVATAARHEITDWELIEKIRERGIGTLLPDVQRTN